MFKALGQPTRLKIIRLLAEKELCVCELEYILGMTQSAVSQHLRVLKEAGLVGDSRSGQWVFYSLDRGRVLEVLEDFRLFLNTDLSGIRDMAGERERLLYLERHPRVDCPRPGVAGSCE